MDRDYTCLSWSSARIWGEIPMKPLVIIAQEHFSVKSTYETLIKIAPFQNHTTKLEQNITFFSSYIMLHHSCSMFSSIKITIFIMKTQLSSVQNPSVIPFHWLRMAFPNWIRIPKIWANYNNSLTWIKAIWGWFPLLTMIPSELVVSSL